MVKNGQNSVYVVVEWPLKWMVYCEFFVLLGKKHPLDIHYLILLWGLLWCLTVLRASSQQIMVVVNCDLNRLSLEGATLGFPCSTFIHVDYFLLGGGVNIFLDQSSLLLLANLIYADRQFIHCGSYGEQFY